MRLLLVVTLLIFIAGCECMPIVQRSYEFMDISECELRTANRALAQTSGVLNETASSLKGMEDQLREANKRLESLDRLVKRFETLPLK